MPADAQRSQFVKLRLGEVRARARSCARASRARLRTIAGMAAVIADDASGSTPARNGAAASVAAPTCVDMYVIVVKKNSTPCVMATRKRTSMHKRAEVEAKIADVKQRRTEEMRRERLRFEAEVCLCAVRSPSHASCTSS